MAKMTSATSLLNHKMIGGKGLPNHKFTHGVVKFEGLMANGMHENQ
jgi:hypothetical protein